MKLWVALLLAVIVTVSAVPQCEHICTMKSDMVEMFENTMTLQAGALRLGFHDCVDNCDGCINFEIGSNNGLQPIVAALKTLYTEKKYKENYGVSRADVWATASVVAVELGVKLSNEQREDKKSCPPFLTDLQWGRTDNEDCSKQTDEEFPNPNMNYEGMMTYFDKQLNFTEEEVVALMGAHSLGESRIGWRGTFTGPDDGKEKTHFDERYYHHMIDKEFKWSNEEAGNGKYQFNADQGGMMFNTDFEMFYNLTLEEETTKTTCTFNPTCAETTCKEDECQPSPTYHTSAEYAEDCTKFIKDFEAVFHKMLQHGTPKLEDKTCDCSTVTEATTEAPSTAAISKAFATSLLLAAIVVVNFF